MEEQADVEEQSPYCNEKVVPEANTTHRQLFPSIAEALETFVNLSFTHCFFSIHLHQRCTGFSSPPFVAKFIVYAFLHCSMARVVTLRSTGSSGQLCFNPLTPSEAVSGGLKNLPLTATKVDLRRLASFEGREVLILLRR
ncbi:hypothetical protein AVEN_36045-1 [Araneus ventricosus]|uniref:Uncharacterized protein n=1 Tax=Araneus ventricosus TaxID=182803 RepID=A0A4Y2UFF9_ARAVE|nr:hypothetical protein AVEN_36045-1 [Araneus ventricosus]